MKISTIQQAFKIANNENRPALLTYIVAGDNNKKKSLEILKYISEYLELPMDLKLLTVHQAKQFLVC